MSHIESLRKLQMYRQGYIEGIISTVEYYAKLQSVTYTKENYMAVLKDLLVDLSPEDLGEIVANYLEDL